MVSKIYVKEYKRGCTSNFSIIIITPYKTNYKDLSLPYVICKMANIQFKFEHVKEAFGMSVYVLSTKIESVKDSNVKVNITCKSPAYSDQSIVGTSDKEWKSMGVLSRSYDWSGVLTFDTEVTITVSKGSSDYMLYAKIYEDTDFADFHLSAADGTVPVHRLFLAAHSDVFKTMLNGDWKETAEGRIQLKGVTRQTLQHLKDFMYLGTLPEDELIHLLLLATRFCVNSLKTACITKITETVTSENLYALLELACANNLPELTFELLKTTPESVISTVSETKNEELSKSAVKNNIEIS